jgi:hypothetical protein
VGYYRPSCRVRIQLRLDEGAQTANLEAGLQLNPPSGAAFDAGLPATQQGAQQGLDSNFQRRQTLNQNRAAMASDELSRERSRLDLERDELQKVAQRQQSQSVPETVDPSKGAKDGLSVIFDVLPQSVQIDRNAMKDADTAKVTLDFRDVPIDPRSVRACFISISLGTVSADDYQAGVVRQQRRDDGSLKSLVSRDPGEELRLDSTTRFTGFVDEWLVQYGEDGDTIELTCRDVSALLRDQKFYAEDGRAKTADLNKPIAEGIQEVIDQFPATRGIQVKFGTPVDPKDPLAVLTPDFGPTPSGIMPKSAKSRKGKQVKARAKVLNQSVWDHITDVVLRMGLVPVLRGFTLFLLEPRVVFADLTSSRRMVWGRNIKALRIARKLGGVKCDTIEVRSPDPTIGRTRWARYPVLQGEPSSGILGDPKSPQPTTTRANNIGPTGKADETVRVMSVPGVSDLKTLERVAENVFNEIGRQEIEGELETDDLDSFESQDEADLLKLLPGEAIQVLVASPIESAPPGQQSPAGKAVRGTSSLQELQAQSISARASYLQGLGMSAETAQRLAIAQEQIRLVSTFRVQKVSITWDIEDGVALVVGYSNWVIVRESPQDATGGNVTQPTLGERAAERDLSQAGGGTPSVGGRTLSDLAGVRSGA